GERLGLPPGAVEREHQLPAEALTQRVPSHEPLELADELRVAAELEIGVDPLLEREYAQLLEARDLICRERFVREVRKRRAAPEAERLVQRLRVAPLEKPLEALEVELAGLDLDGVAGGSRDDPLCAEELAQLRDVVLDRVASGAGRLSAPQLVDQAIGRDDLVRPREQQGQHGPLAGPAEIEGIAPIGNLARPGNS